MNPPHPGETGVDLPRPGRCAVLGVLNVYFIKPTYMLMSAYLLKRLWRYGEPELRWLWWGLLAFLVGEGACAVNYGVCGMQSVPWEMVHNGGMVIAIGFLNMGALEVVDRRMVFQFVQGKACALMRFCREGPLRAMRNLTANAIEWSEPGSQVDVHVLGENGLVTVIVDDAGPGVPEDLRERIFEAFFRGPQAKGRRIGYGLGLAIVRAAVDSQGGTVEVGRSPLGGARFRMRLPRNMGQPPTDETPSPI